MTTLKEFDEFAKKYIEQLEQLARDTSRYEKIRIDNLTKLILDENNKNKFECCNAKWVELKPRVDNVINVSGRCSIKIICEFPILY